MPFARDSRSTLRQKALADIASRLAGSNPFLRRSILNVIGLVVADQHADQLGYLDWISRQGVPFTATEEFLVAWAALKGVSQKAASVATGLAAFTGTAATPVPAGVVLSRSDGWLYTVDSGGTLDGSGLGTFAVTASFAGSNGNCDQGTPLAVASVAGIDPTATAYGAIAGGADIESFEKLRGRMLEAFANPPQGGSAADYVTWALAVPGVTRAWSAGSQLMGPGSVTVFFMMDDSESAHAGIPQGTNGVSQFEPRASSAVGDQLIVADAIFPLRPVTSLVWAMAPTAVALNLTLAEVPNDTTIRAGIAAALQGVLLREASPGGSFMTLPGQAGVVRVSHIEDAIAAVPGLDHFVLSAPSADVAVAAGHISTPGSISYV